jgi:N-acetylglucosamine kinase-like BadF-type ATPase
MIGIGFGSGGSHTTYAVERGAGESLPVANEYGESIADARSPNSTASAIRWMVNVINSQPDDEICVWIGAAGFSGSSAPRIMEAFRPHLAELSPAGRSIEVYVANDAVSLLKAPPLNGAGVVAVVGTGSVVMGSHPRCLEGVVRRGGFEWLVSDEGSGVWMTLEAIRLLLRDIQARGSYSYYSPLLDRLCDYFGVGSLETSVIPETHRSLARADLLARVVSESRPDMKRRIAGFVYPHLFDLASVEPGRTRDPLAAEALSSSVRIIAEGVAEVSAELAAHTADNVNARERLTVVVAGNIAINPRYDHELKDAVSKLPYVHSVETIGDGARHFAQLAHRYAGAAKAEQIEIVRSFDPVHSVLKVL